MKRPGDGKSAPLFAELRMPSGGELAFSESRDQLGWKVDRRFSQKVESGFRQAALASWRLFGDTLSEKSS